MELRHIELSNLSVSATNMRAKGKARDLGGILPSIRARGILVPLIVRANGQLDHYEIVAGKRRYHAALTLRRRRAASTRCPAWSWKPVTMQRRWRHR